MRVLGTTGVRVSPLCLGAMMFGSWGNPDHEESARIIGRALDAGINFIDTADVYSGGESEEIVGKALAGGRRDRIVLATKVHAPMGQDANERGNSRRWIIRECENSLRRLGTDYIDLYQIHDWDGDTPLEETLRTLDDMMRSGKVRYIGTSNYAAWQLCKALWVSDRRNFLRFESVQPSYSLADRAVERELVPLCLDQGIGVIAYFPLAGGILTGKYRRGQEPPKGSRAVTQPQFARRINEPSLRLSEEVVALASEVHCTPSQLALAWLIRQPAVCSAIAGATSVAQLRENLGALDVKLADNVLARLDEVSRPFV